MFNLKKNSQKIQLSLASYKHCNAFYLFLLILETKSFKFILFNNLESIKKFTLPIDFCCCVFY